MPAHKTDYQLLITHLSRNGELATFFRTRLVLSEAKDPAFSGCCDTPAPTAGAVWPAFNAFVLSLPVVTNFETIPKMVRYLVSGQMITGTQEMHSTASLVLFARARAWLHKIILFRRRTRPAHKTNY